MDEMLEDSDAEMIESVLETRRIIYAVPRTIDVVLDIMLWSVHSPMPEVDLASIKSKLDPVFGLPGVVARARESYESNLVVYTSCAVIVSHI